jgi:hypothetical protein
MPEKEVANGFGIAVVPVLFDRKRLMKFYQSVERDRQNVFWK